MRSDWDSAPVSEHGDDDHDNDHTENNTEANGASGANGRDEKGRRWTIFNEDDESKKNRESADEHVQNYVQDQLKRLMSPDGNNEFEDEIEAKYDGM